MKEFVEKLIERLEERKQLHNRVIAYEQKSGTVTEEFQQRKAVEVLDDAIEIINQLAEEYNQDSTKNNQGWILCSERLPEEPDIQFQALEYFPEYNVTIAGAEQSTTLKYLGAGEWSDTEGNSYNVIAWQQLPKAYRPEEEHEIVRTRIEYICSMSVEEMADKILASAISTTIDFCQEFSECQDLNEKGEEIPDEMCKKCLVKWLNSVEQ